MRSMFPGYYPPSEQELEKLWNQGLIVVDTNALLNLFRYTATTRMTFLQILREKAERLWLPHQVGLEFHKNRLDVIKDQQSAFKKLVDKTSSARNSIISEIGARRHHPSLDLDGLRKTVADAMALIEKEIEAKQSAYENSVETENQHDKTTREITGLYDGRVGEPYTEERLQEIYREGEKRYENKQPPGYKDGNKPTPDRYGDLVLWHQILDEGQKRELPILFVTDDGKEDWWRTSDGKTIGPRVELIEEFHARAGQRVHFYSPQEFMRYAALHDASITQETMTEVGEVSDAWADALEHSAHPYASEYSESSEHKEMLDRLASEYLEVQDEITFFERRLNDYYDRLVKYTPSDIDETWGGEDTTSQALQHEISKLGQRLARLHQHQEALTSAINNLNQRDTPERRDTKQRSWVSEGRELREWQPQGPRTAREREELRRREQQALRQARRHRNDRAHLRVRPEEER